MKEIHDNNVLIAKYMGAKERLAFTSTKTVIFPNNKQYRLRDLKYHKNLNWIIPVLQKITMEENVIRVIISNVYPPESIKLTVKDSDGSLKDIVSTDGDLLTQLNYVCLEYIRINITSKLKQLVMNI